MAQPTRSAYQPAPAREIDERNRHNGCQNAQKNRLRVGKFSPCFRI
jgi:hypothetical protein